MAATLKILLFVLLLLFSTVRYPGRQHATIWKRSDKNIVTRKHLLPNDFTNVQTWRKNANTMVKICEANIREMVIKNDFYILNSNRLPVVSQCQLMCPTPSTWPVLERKKMAISKWKKGLFQMSVALHGLTFTNNPVQTYITITI